jgi:hypothetical protein
MYLARCFVFGEFNQFSAKICRFIPFSTKNFASFRQIFGDFCQFSEKNIVIAVGGLGTANYKSIANKFANPRSSRG